MPMEIKTYVIYIGVNTFSIKTLLAFLLSCFDRLAYPYIAV